MFRRSTRDRAVRWAGFDRCFEMARERGLMAFMPGQMALAVSVCCTNSQTVCVGTLLCYDTVRATPW